MTKRPLFVTLLSLWLILCGFLSPLFLLTIADSEFAERLAAQPQMGLWSLISQRYGTLGVALFGMTLMLVPGLVGFGLWRMHPWARVIIVGVAALNVLWGTYAITRTFLQHATFDYGGAICLVIFALLLYYFERSNIKHLFQKQRRMV